MVFFHIKDALENPSSSEDGNDYDYLIRAINDVAVARGKTSLAEEAGISRQYLYKVLNGDSVPSIQNIMAILEVLGLKFTVQRISEVVSDDVPAKVLDVAEYIRGLIVRNATTMKLQKLVYYSQVESLVRFDRALFAEPIEAWPAGPVVKKLFEQHKGRRSLDNLSFGSAENLSMEQKACINSVLDKYGMMTGDSLSHLTHIEDPWKNARRGHGQKEHSSTEITKEVLKKYYSTLPDYSELDNEVC